MKKITLISIILAAFATKSFAHCPIPQWCPSADLHQVLCPGEAINPIEFPSVIGKTLIINWWTDGTRFASINTPDGITVSGPPDNREHSAPVSIKGAPAVAGTHHYTVSNTCGVELLHGSVTLAGPPTIGTVTPTGERYTTVGTAFTPLTLTAEPAGSMPPITIQWFSNTTASNSGGISMGTANGAQTDTFTPPSNVVNTDGIYYYAVAIDRCGNTATTSNTSGKHIVVPACPGTPGNLSLCTGVQNVASPGTVSWQGSTNIETHARTISGNGITQRWSGVVTTSNCSSRATFTANNTVTDCRNSINGFSGNYFNFCFVIRYQDQLCPAPWRVPVCQDFVNLDVALGGTGHNRWLNGTGNADPASVPSSDKTIEAQIEWYIGGAGSGDIAVNNGGIWGGSRFAAIATNLSVGGSNYWSSSQNSGTNAFHLRLNPSAVYPQNNIEKYYGLALRCVRDVP
ncbi:MAG: fibrobacter succinogenes major paralogous domain-containing protein [Bacteroidales bacterium]|nr:fibrobacter succinogenes major paralogous domain-containing protein [Bacteroidales bacterium]